MTTELTLNEIRSRGYAALVRELGPTGYVRFIQHFQVGTGNFTTERRQWTDALTLEQLKKMILDRRTSRAGDAEGRGGDA